MHLPILSLPLMVVLFGVVLFGVVLSYTPVLADVSSELFDPQAIVAVKVEGKSGFCSGVLVAHDVVLTATHCVHDLAGQTYFPAESTWVGVGENMFADDFDWVSVKEIKIERVTPIKTESDYRLHDVVRLKLREPLSTRPLTIATTLEANAPLRGWGFGEDEWGYYGIRKARALEEISIEPELIAFSAGACRGDSGGPVLDDKFRVVGIISLSEVPHCVNRGKRIAQRLMQHRFIDSK